LEPVDGIKYRVIFDNDIKIEKSTDTDPSVEIQPKSTNPVKIFVWSRNKKSYKLIDTVIPKIGQSQLVYERMKTFKHISKTHQHPADSTAKSTIPAKSSRADLAVPKSSETSKKTATAETPPKDNQGVIPNQTRNNHDEPEHQANRPIPDQITVTQLKNIFPAATEDYLQKIAEELNTDLSKYKLDSILRRAHFFAQVREEAGPALTANEENLNYKVSGLSCFKYYRNNPETAKLHGRVENPNNKKKPLQLANQEAIANHAYGNREGNGDPTSGDGWRYKGRGIFQLTFKKNYAAFERDYSKYWLGPTPSFTKNPEKIKEFPHAVRSAVWFWITNEIYKIAEQGASDAVVEKVTAIINPGKKHLLERQKNFKNLTYPAFK
jgi:putative chitinase